MNLYEYQRSRSFIDLGPRSLRFTFLAHLSRRLTRWAYSIAVVRRPSVVRHRPHFQTCISLKPAGQPRSNFMCSITWVGGERGGSVVECRTPEREVRGSRPTAAVLCPWARHFTPRKYWLITQEAMAPSRYDWKIVDWDVKPQHNQPTWVGERLHKVLGQIRSKLWFPWQQKAPIELQWEKRCLHLFSVVFDRIFFILAGNEDMHKISDEFEFPPGRTTDYGVSCPWASKKFPIDL